MGYIGPGRNYTGNTGPGIIKGVLQGLLGGIPGG